MIATSTPETHVQRVLRRLTQAEAYRMMVARFGEFCTLAYCVADDPQWNVRAGDWLVLNMFGRPIGAIGSRGGIYDEAE